MKKPVKDWLTAAEDVYTDARYPSAIGLLPNGKPSLEVTERFFCFAKNILDKADNHLKDSDTSQ